jgi:hypothetical protein
MKKLISIILVFICSGFVAKVKAQILHPVKWSYAAKKTGKKEASIFLKATIDGGWHIYSTAQKDGGPVKTSFTFNPTNEYNLTGTINEPKPITKYEKAFEMDVSYFESAVIFQQKVKLNIANPIIKGTLKFMVCNDRQCLPPETVSFSIPVK